MKNSKSGRFTFASVIRKLLLAWLAAACVEYLLVPGMAKSLDGTAAPAMMSLLRLLLVAAAVMIILLILSRYVRTRQLERWGIAAAFALLALLTLIASFRWAYLGACLLVLLILLVFCVKGWNSCKERRLREKEHGRTSLWVTAAITALFFLLLSAWGIGRVYSFGAPTYDFGIFSQMFYSMRTTGLPVTTLEREMRISHFYVHMSPIYYLMLPFYCLAPFPATLQVLQAAVLASAVIPMWKIGANHGLPGWQRLLLCLLLMLYPAFGGGTGYDLHENCFLSPLLLWLFYGIERKNIPATTVFTLLTLAVKEDAAVYTAVIALWLLVRGLLYGKKWDLLTGVGMMALSLLWFLSATGFLAKVGDGVMTYRYNNFIYDGSSSLLTVVKAAILCPMKVLYESVDKEKLSYIALTLLPLLGLPFMTRRYERFLLLIPYVLVNLMSDYEYQHSIFFQYNFGSTVFLLYLTTVNLADIKDGTLRFVTLLSAAAVSLTFFSVTVLPEAVSYPVKSVQYGAFYRQIHAALDTIPEEASVTASSHYTASLSQRDTVYNIGYASPEQLLSTEYVVISLKDSCDLYKAGQEGKGFENLVALLESSGYSPYAEIRNVLIVYRRLAS